MKTCTVAKILSEIESKSSKAMKFNTIQFPIELSDGRKVELSLTLHPKMKYCVITIIGIRELKYKRFILDIDSGKLYSETGEFQGQYILSENLTKSENQEVLSRATKVLKRSTCGSTKLYYKAPKTETIVMDEIIVPVKPKNGIWKRIVRVGSFVSSSVWNFVHYSSILVWTALGPYISIGLLLFLLYKGCVLIKGKDDCLDLIGKQADLVKKWLSNFIREAFAPATPQKAYEIAKIASDMKKAKVDYKDICPVPAPQFLGFECYPEDYNASLQTINEELVELGDKIWWEHLNSLLRITGGTILSVGLGLVFAEIGIWID